MVQCLKIPFKQTPFQNSIPETKRKKSRTEKLQINSEIHEMLREGVIQQVHGKLGSWQTSRHFLLG